MTPKATSKSDQVRQLLKSKMNAAAIAKQVGCTVGLVYNVKSTSGQVRRRGPGRPRKSNSELSIASILKMVKGSERERLRRRAALQRIQEIAAKALE